ncbi:MAG: hypothetical protein KUF72_03710 [Candidatus Thiodiazotropha sp. (ex Ctena orbiculata)]|nr:hypothetical protein [Candidatus Thiodiazotropha taylori]
MNREEFEKLKPKELPTLEIEPFSEVVPRLRKALPNFPECVLEQWIYRHFNQIDDYWWLGLDGLSFKKEIWSNQEILKKIGSNMLDTQDYWGDQLLIEKEPIRLTTWLAKFFAKNRTWPKLIIILHNEHELKRPNGLELYRPYHLLEGHMRLAYMRGYIRHSIPQTPQTHEVWVTTCNPEMISDVW